MFCKQNLVSCAPAGALPHPQTLGAGNVAGAKVGTLPWVHAGRVDLHGLPGY